MKQLIGKDVGSYSFDPANRTITFYNIPNITQEQILLVTNTTDGLIIYSFADSTLGGTLWGNVLTLASNTTAMSADDHLQIYIDIPAVVTPSSKTETNIFLDGMASDAIPTSNEQLQNVLGNTSLVGRSGGLKVEDQYLDVSVNGTITTAQSQIAANFNGKSVAVIQIAGTWAGTLTFEGTATLGDWVTISGQLINGAISATSTTTNGIFRFNVTGLTGIRARYTTYTSGAPTITINVSAAPTGTHPNVSVIGSQSTAITQRATTFEALTYDANLATVLGTGTVISPQAVPLPIAPVAPTANAGAVGNLFNNIPTIFPRIRAEIAGSERLPFAQEKNTNKMQVTNDDAIILLKQILNALKVMNCFTLQQLDYNGFKNLQVPVGYEDILTKVEQRSE
jgi:hypothetical protein